MTGSKILEILLPGYSVNVDDDRNIWVGLYGEERDPIKRIPKYSIIRKQHVVVASDTAPQLFRVPKNISTEAIIEFRTSSVTLPISLGYSVRLSRRSAFVEIFTPGGCFDAIWYVIPIPFGWGQTDSRDLQNKIPVRAVFRLKEAVGVINWDQHKKTLVVYPNRGFIEGYKSAVAAADQERILLHGVTSLKGLTTDKALIVDLVDGKLFLAGYV